MEPNAELTGESSVITRPVDEELLAKLERKKKEYLSRIGDEFTHPEQAIVLGLAAGSVNPLDAYIKYSLLAKVLEEGSVSTWEFSRQILEDPVIAAVLDKAMFEVVDRTSTACAVIDAYCSNNLAATIGGTGLR